MKLLATLSLALLLSACGGGGDGPPPPPDPGSDDPPQATSVLLAPANVVALASGNDAARISWTDRSDNEDGFSLERAVSANGPYTVVGSTPANVRSLDDTGLAAGSAYHWRVRAHNAAARSAYSNIANLTLPTLATPQAPDALSAVPDGNAVLLRWTDTSNNETGFGIERAQPPGNFSALGSALAGSTAFRDSTATAGREARYRVRAIGAAGNSAYSNTAALLVPGTTVHTLTIRRTGSGTGAVTSDVGNLNCTAPTCTLSTAAGTRIALNAVNGSNSDFVRWTGCENNTGLNGSTCGVTLDGLMTVTAEFAARPAVTLNAAIAPPISSDGNYTLSWTYGANASGPWTIQAAPDRNFAAPAQESYDDAAPPYQRVYANQPDGQHCYRLRTTAMPPGAFSEPACVTVSRPATTGLFKVLNHTPYRLVSLTIDGQQQIAGAQSTVPAGGFGTMALTPGTLAYNLGVGFLPPSGPRDVWFHLAGNASVSAGGTTELDFKLTVPDLLSGFDAYRDWAGEYWTTVNGNLVLGTKRYRFHRSGAWEFFVNGASAGQGSALAQTSWPLDGLLVRFTPCAACAEGKLGYPFGSFYMDNGPSDWRTIRYVAQ